MFKCVKVRNFIFWSVCKCCVNYVFSDQYSPLMISLKSIVFGNNICAILYWYWISFRLLINVFAHTFYFVLSKYFTDMLWFIFQICHNNVKKIYMSYCPSHDTDWKINEKLSWYLSDHIVMLYVCYFKINMKI